MFTNEVLQRGIALWGLRTHPLAEITWATFERLFLHKHFPNDTRNGMWSEFFNLKQGDMIIMEYETKFLALALFATAQLTDENFKGAQFEEGLKPSIQTNLAPLQLKSFTDILAIGLANKIKDL